MARMPRMACWLADYPDPSFSLIRRFLSYSRDVLCSLLFHILGNDPCQTCWRWLGWKGHVKQDSSKWTEHITNLVPRFGLKFFLLVLTKRSHTSLVFSVGLCKATPAALLEQHSDFPPSIDWILAFNSVLTCKNVNTASKKKCGSWEKSAESYRSAFRKWRHLYFSRELWVLVGIQAAGTWRFNGGRKLIDSECGKKGFPFIV